MGANRLKTFADKLSATVEAYVRQEAVEIQPVIKKIVALCLALVLNVEMLESA